MILPKQIFRALDTQARTPVPHVEKPVSGKTVGPNGARDRLWRVTKCSLELSPTDDGQELFNGEGVVICVHGEAN